MRPALSNFARTSRKRSSGSAIRHSRSAWRVLVYSGVRCAGGWPNRPPLITCGAPCGNTVTSSTLADAERKALLDDDVDRIAAGVLRQRIQRSGDQADLDAADG